MANFNGESPLADLADGTLGGPEWDAWLASHPEEAEEIMIARQVRALMLRLRDAEIQVPADFETRLMEQVRGDKALLDLLDLSLAGLGRALVELLNLLFGLLPEPPISSNAVPA